MKRGSLFLAMAASASGLVACAALVGIDDVTLRDAGNADAADDTIGLETSTIVDSSPGADAPIEIDAGPCKVCSGAGETTACALVCDLPAPTGLALDEVGSYVYFTNAGLDPNGAGSSVWKVNLAGGVPPTLLEDAGAGRPNAIAYAPLRKVALFAVPGSNTIRVTDGGAAGASAWSTANTPQRIAIAAGGGGGIVFYKSVSALIVTSVDNPGAATPYLGEPINDFSVNAPAARIGWTTQAASNDVYYADASAFGSALLASSQSSATHVALTSGDDPTTYAWSILPGGGAEIHSHGTGSNTSTPLWSGQSVGGMQFSPDDTGLYFTDTIAGTVSVIVNGGGPAQIIASAQDSPGEIAVGANWVVWVARGSTANANGRVMRIAR